RAGGEGEEGVVAAPTDVLAGGDARAALADDDGAGVHDTAVEHLHAEALALGITAVPGGTAALGLRHGSALRDLGDLDGVVLLAVTPAATVVCLVLAGEPRALRALRLAQHLGGPAGLGALIRGGADGVAVGQQHGRERHVALGGTQALDLDRLSLLDPVL